LYCGGHELPKIESQVKTVSQNNLDRIRGVFSSQEIRRVGTGTTTRKTVSKVFWFAEEDEEKRIMIQPINSNYIPTGNKKQVTRDELIENYLPEPEFYVQSVYPKMRELNETIDQADKFREKGEIFSAEYQYDTALAVDVENVRANFGIGLTYLARGETDKADNILSRLINLEGAYEEEHKHLFNDFGISLRKNKMIKQSIEYYQRAEELSKGDDNLYLNMARVYLDAKDIPHVLEYLGKALSLSPNNEIAHKFLDWMQSANMINKNQAQALLSGAGSDGQQQPDALSDEIAAKPEDDDQ